MNGVCFENQNEFLVLWEDGNTCCGESEWFFNEMLAEILRGDSKTLFFHDLRTWGLGIVFALAQMGYVDITQAAVETNTCPKPKSGHFLYTVAARTGTWFSITVTGKNGGTLMILSYENFVPVDDEMLLNDFCEGDDLYSMAQGALKSVQMMHNIGCNRLTVASSATSIWARGFNRYDISSLFPEPDKEVYDFIKSAHHGGLCYVNRHGKVGRGIVLDNNSLYPYVMSTCKMPVGKPKKFEGEPKKFWLNNEFKGFYVRLQCRFQLKDGYVPFIRIKDDPKYRYDEVLTTSDLYDKATDAYYDEWVDEWGEIFEVRATLTLWKDEYKLFFEHYDVEDIVYLGGYSFNMWGNVFKTYMDTFAKMKEEATNPSERRIAKIMMNSLSGNLAKNKERESCYFTEDGLAGIKAFGEYQKKEHTTGSRSVKISSDNWGHTHFLDLQIEEVLRQCSRSETTESRSHSYIAIGAAITSMAMCITVRAAQANYEHFLYTDTDSLHLDCSLDEVIGLEVDDKKMGAWKVEHEFYNAAYIQPKVYMINDSKDGITVKWSGMKDTSRKLLESAIYNIMTDAFENPFVEEETFERGDETISDFSWNSFKGQVKDGKNAVIKIPYGRYELTDFVTYKKSIVSGAYTVDIHQFV